MATGFLHPDLIEVPIMKEEMKKIWKKKEPGLFQGTLRVYVWNYFGKLRNNSVQVVRAQVRI
jgi:hypothetical protein